MRFLLAILLVLTISSAASACRIGQVVSYGPRPPAIAAQSDYARVSVPTFSAAAATIDSDESAWFWSNQTLTHVSHHRVVASYHTELKALGASFVEADGVGGAWVATGDPIEHIDASGHSTVYIIPVAINDFIVSGSRAYFGDRATGRIGEFTFNGNVLYRALPKGLAASSLATDDRDNVWFTTYGRSVGVATPDGRVFTYATKGAPLRIVRGNERDFWFIEGAGSARVLAAGEKTGYDIAHGFVGHITEAGALEEYPISLYAAPRDIAITPDNHVFILEYTGVLATFDARSQRVVERSLPSQNADRLKLTAEGRLYVATQTGQMLAATSF